MAYVKNTWVDQDVERPKTYQVTTNQDGSITLTDDFGLVTDLGTPVNATNMNHIEDGIDNHETRITALEGASNANTNLSNVTNTGTSTGASWAMPSDTYDELILGASGTTYTAPANGWFLFEKLLENSTFIRLENTSTGFAQEGTGGGTANLPCVFVPVLKTDEVRITYDGITTGFTAIRFYYAQGSESEAQ